MVDGQPLLPKLTSVIEAKAGTRLSLMHIELGAERVHNANKRQTMKGPEDPFASPQNSNRPRSRTFGSTRDRGRKNVSKSKARSRKPNEKVLHEKQQIAAASAVKSKSRRKTSHERSRKKA